MSRENSFPGSRTSRGPGPRAWCPRFALPLGEPGWGIYAKDHVPSLKGLGILGKRVPSLERLGYLMPSRFAGLRYRWAVYDVPLRGAGLSKGLAGAQRRRFHRLRPREGLLRSVRTVVQQVSSQARSVIGNYTYLPSISGVGGYLRFRPCNLSSLRLLSIQ